MLELKICGQTLREMRAKVLISRSGRSSGKAEKEKNRGKETKQRLKSGKRVEIDQGRHNAWPSNEEKEAR